MKEFKDKVALITGGSSGIGLGIARALAKEGANIVVVGMTPAKIASAVEDLTGIGVKAIGIKCDVTKRDQVAKMADEAYGAFGRVDILVNNAGLGSGGSVDKLSENDWDWVMEVNVRGIFVCCNVIIPRMLEAGNPGYIINMGSEQCFGLADPAFGSMAVYTASKHAVLGLSRAMRRDYADKGLEVGIVCPGPVATEIWNAERNRSPEFGQKNEVSPERGKMIHDMGMDPDLVGWMTVEGMKAGDFYIMTHDYIRDMVETNYREASAALDKTDTWLSSQASG